MAGEEVYGSLECNVPASITIEEMLVGRLTAKQLGFVCVGAALFYNAVFKFPNRTIGIAMGVVIAVLVYLLGFYKIKKYDSYLYEHWYYQFKFKTEQQVFINK